MKNLLSILVVILVCVSASAQKATLRFEGSANANNTSVRNYMVDLDGQRYYSTDANLAVSGNARLVDVNDLALGSHRIAIYEINNNSTGIGSTSDPIYSKDFQLRSGYDMVIAIRKNGQVSFSEKRTNQNTASSSRTPMSETEFQKQLASVNTKWSQTSRY